jgi:sugar phosphate isomerase/epimerase
MLIEVDDDPSVVVPLKCVGHVVLLDETSNCVPYSYRSKYCRTEAGGAIRHGNWKHRGMHTELVLTAGCLAAAPFREYAAAAASAGFDAITIWPLCYQRAIRREGLDAVTMRSIVADLGMRICELDPVGVWLPPPPDADELPAMFRSVWARHQFFEVASALGVGALTAVELAGNPVDPEVAVEGFATLCDDAAEHGLDVTLEFMPFSGIPDLRSALRIVEGADRRNGGVLFDVCHFVRSGGSPADIDAATASRIVSIQLGDGPRTAPGDLRDEAMFHRMSPGDGEFDVARLIATLDAAGARARIGPELYRRGFSEREPAVVAADLMAATERVLTAPPSTP